MLSPVIIYNYYTYQTRGHFDAALSSMVGMQPEDFKGVAKRTGERSLVNLGNNFITIGQVLKDNNSAPLLLLFVLSIILLIYRTIKNQSRELERLILLSLISLSAMFLFLPPAERYLSLVTPFISLALGLFMAEAIKWSLSRKEKILPVIISTAFGLILIFELIYSLNTNVFLQPRGFSPLFYSKNRLENLGFNNLSNHLRQNLFPVLPKKYPVKNYTDLNIGPAQITNRPVVIYDDSIIWSAWLWNLLRYQTYYKLPLIPMEYVIAQGGGANKFVSDFARISGREVYFIRAVKPQLLDPLNDTREQKVNYLNRLDQQFARLKVPTEEIKNNHGEVAFKLYYLKNKDISYLSLINF